MGLKFVTRERAKVDRIACAWLIKRFIDPSAEVHYVPSSDVKRFAAAEGALPFDVPDVELGHHGEFCSFDAFLQKYNLTDHALRKMAAIVRGADTDNRSLTDESQGLFAIASGFHALSPRRFANDHALWEVEFPVYDALYEFCKTSAT